MLSIIDHTYHEAELPPACQAYARDTITLGWEDRLKAHARRRSDGGVEFGTSLPRGAILRDGECFVLDAERVVIKIAERPEPVFVIEPRTPLEWGLFAYHIGNRHQPIMITDRAIVCPDLPGVEQLLQQHQMPFVRSKLPFTPAAAVAAHHH